MVISFQKSFLFIHIPKTGGTSVRVALSPYQHQNEDFWSNRLLSKVGISVNYCLGDYRHLRFRTHDPVSVVAREFPPHVFNSLFKFAFVRNPWDVLVSTYKYIQAGPSHKRHKLVNGQSFDDFLGFAISRDIGQQRRLIADANGKLLVDFVGRFEHLSNDFKQITNRLGISVELLHVNRAGKKTDYREFYSKRTMERVHFAYRDDIDTFEYEFDPSSIATNRNAMAA